MKQTLLFCVKSLTKKEQDILAKHPEVTVYFTDCVGLDESQPVVYQLPEGTFYGHVTPSRLSDVIVHTADDLKIQTARLFDVTMKTYKSEPKHRNTVLAFYRELVELDAFTEKDIKHLMKDFRKDHHLSKDDLEFPLKMALIKTIKGPDVKDLLVALGWKNTKKILDDYASFTKYRI